MPQSYFNTDDFHTILSDFIAVIYPEVCIGCGNVLLRNDRLICLECLVNLPYTRFESIAENPVEKLFLLKVKVEEAMAAFSFAKDNSIQHIIHAFKYKRNEDAAVFMGEMLGACLLNSSRFKTIDIIMPVPLHNNKLKKRGYNQAERIAVGIQRVLGLPVDTKSIVRVEANETQTKKGLFERWENVKTIFYLANTETLKNKHVLLVDDVITSGSTIEACTLEVLKCSGSRVSIATLAMAV